MVSPPRAVLTALLAALLLIPGYARAGRAGVHGEFTLGARYYPSDLVPGNDVEWTLAARLETYWDPTPDVRLFAAPGVLEDPLDPGRFRWVPDELWVEGRRGPARLRVGRTVTRWGSADAINPTDVAAVRDWGTDFLDPGLPGDWSAVTSVSRAAWGVEAVVLPVLEGARLPSARSRWSLQAAAARSGYPVTVLLDDTPRLAPDTGEFSAGARVRVTGGGTDLYLVGYTGVDRRPVLTGVPGFEGEAIYARTTYLPLHLAGLEVQSAVGGWLLKGAIAYQDRSVADSAFADEVFGEYGLRPYSWLGVAGVEYLWLDVLDGPGSLDLTSEYIRDNGPRDDNLAVFRPLQNDLAIAATYRFGDFADTLVEAGWLQDLERPESVVTVRVSRRFGTRIRGEAGVDVVRGGNDPRSPFYLFAPNDRVVAQLTGGF